jgi:hypothetical protein
MPAERFGNLKGLVPDELLEALRREAEHPDPLESNEEWARSIVDATLLEVASMTGGTTEALASGIEQVANDSASALSEESDTLNARIDDLRDATVDDIQEAADSVRSEMDAKVDQAFDGALAYASDESDVLTNRIDDVVEEIDGTVQAATDSVNDELAAKVEQAFDGAIAYASEESDVINNRVDDVVEETTDDIRAATNSVRAELEASVAQARNDYLAALSSEVEELNNRIGKKDTITTTTAAPTVAATIAPLARGSYLIGAKVVGLRNDHRESAAYTILTQARALPSEEICTFLANANNGDQAQIGSETYTFETVLTPGGTNNVLIAGTAAGTLINWIKAIDDSGVPDTDYGSGTLKHPTFTGWDGPGDTMVAIARVPGTAADGTATTENTAGARLSWGAAVTSGGSDMTLFNPGAPVTIINEDDAAWAVAIAANGVNVEITVTGAAGKAITWTVETEITKIVTFID